MKNLTVISLGLSLYCYSAARAEIFSMTCFPEGASIYQAAYNTENHLGIIIGSHSGHVTKYVAFDVVNKPEKQMLYVALKAPKQTRTLYFAFDYSTGSRDVSSLRTKDGVKDASDKCRMATSSAQPLTSTPPSTGAPMPTPTQPIAADIDVMPCKDVRDYRECAVIGVFGPIGPDDDTIFDKKTVGITKAIVVLSGPGGILESSINIGETIHAKGWNTVVPKGESCLSGCAYIWAAGIERRMEPNSTIGFHSAFRSTDNQHASGSGNGLIGMYLRDLDYNFENVQWMIGTDPNDWAYIKADSDGVATSSQVREE